MGGRYKTIHRNDEIYRERALTRRKEEQEEEMRDKRLGVFRNTFSRTDKIPPFVLICAAHKCPQVYHDRFPLPLSLLRHCLWNMEIGLIAR